MFSLAEFETSLEYGTGRAAIIIQAFYPAHAAELRPALLYAVHNDLRLDHQTMDIRSLYLFDLIALTGEQEFFRSETLKALAAFTDDNFYQLMELTRRFAQQGDEEARRALYAAFEKNALAEREPESDGEIVRLDGADGLLWLAERYREEVFGEKGYDVEKIGFLISELEEQNGKEQAWRDLETKCSPNPVYAAWFQEWKAYRDSEETRRAEWRRDDAKRPQATYEELRQAIAKNGSKVGYASVSWGKRATKEELERAAHDLLVETETERILAMIRIFTRASFPLDPAPLIEWAKSEDEALHWFSQQALAQISSPVVRDFALELLGQGQERDLPYAVDMLAANYKKGDERGVLQLLARPLADPDYRHWLCMHAGHFEEKHPSAISTKILLALYTETNCSLCRNGFVRRLHKLKALPEWMRDELPYDADEDTRKYAANFPSEIHSAGRRSS